MNALRIQRELFGDLFALPSFIAAGVLVGALFGVPMVEVAALLAVPVKTVAGIYEKHTGRAAWPARQAAEGWIIAGRRSGKSLLAAFAAVYRAAFVDYRPLLAPGERPVVLAVATNRAQAKVVLGYVRGLLRAVPMLERAVVRETAEEIELESGVTLAVHPANHASIRGRTIVALIGDEIAFWPQEGAASPDSEILTAVRPAMATIPGALLLLIGSPYARRGEMFRAFERHYAQEGDVFVWRARSLDMNPSLPESVVARALERDPAAAAAEWNAEFRSDVEAFLDRDVVAACIEPGRYELPPLGPLRYAGFVDPSGGSNDAMTLAVGHREGDTAVIDLVREVRPPFSPEAVVEDFAKALERYGVASVVGDRYGGEWPRERFRRNGIQYALASKPKSDLYRELLPAIRSGRVELLDSDRVVAQLVSLERRTARSGRDSIDHPPGGHDDLANAVAGAVDLVLRGREPGDFGVTI